MQKNRTHFTHRFLALFLCLALGLPSGADVYPELSRRTLKPQETPESAGLKQLTQTLAPSAGLEEKFGLTAKDISGLSLLFKIEVPLIETLDNFEWLIAEVSGIVAEGFFPGQPLSPAEKAFARTVLKKLYAKRLKFTEAVLTPSTEPVPAAPQPSVSAQPPAGSPERFDLTPREYALLTGQFLREGGSQVRMTGMRWRNWMRLFESFIHSLGPPISRDGNGPPPIGRWLL